MPPRPALLKRMRYYLSQLPPENILPHKKLNASSRAVLNTRPFRDGMAEAIEDIQQNLLYSYLNKRRRQGLTGQVEKVDTSAGKGAA